MLVNISKLLNMFGMKTTGHTLALIIAESGVGVNVSEASQDTRTEKKVYIQQQCNHHRQRFMAESINDADA
jgi:ribosome-associated protein YbcJ (S4-like RNA binding protein)